MAFRFHENHGKYVVLSNNQKTARYTATNHNGTVMARDPMKVNKVYEVQIMETDGVDYTLCVGVVTSSPDSLTLPLEALGWESAVVVEGDIVTDHSDMESSSDIEGAMDDLPLHSSVGMSVDGSRRLHLHVNGDDKGIVPCRSLPDPCWAMWDLDSDYREVKALPVRDV